eukprot:289898_1
MTSGNTFCLNINGLDAVVEPCTQYYGATVTLAIQEVKDWYVKESFDDEDITNDWIANDDQNCHGIDIFIDKIQHNNINRKLLFNWFTYWLKVISEPPTEELITDITTNSPFNQIYSDIIKVFSIYYNQNISQRISQLFQHNIEEEQFQDIETINEDIQDINDPNESMILSDILIKITEEFKDTEIDSNIITSGIQQICVGKTKQLIEEMKEHKNKLPDFIFRAGNDKEDIAKRIAQKMQIIYTDPLASNNTPDNTMIKCKAMDLQNNYAIFLSMLDAFSRDKIKRYKINPEKEFEIKTWWNDKNNYLARKIEQDLLATKLDISMYEIALKTLVKRSINEMELNPKTHSIIYDSLYVFAKYTIEFQEFCLAQFIQNEFEYESKMDKVCYFEKIYSVPIHVDLWIIPKGVKQQNEKYCSEMMTCRMTVIKDLKSYFDECKYIENEDYFMYKSNESNSKNCNRKQGKFRDLWYKYTQLQNKIGCLKTHKRLIFIVDRRNQNKFANGWENENINNLCEYEKECADIFYLMIPKYKPMGLECINIPFYCDLWPEILLGLNKSFLLPSKGGRVIGMTEPFKGYKFVISHHILSSECCKRYLYFGAGAIRFELNDMMWLWPKYFVNNQSLKDKINITWDNKNSFRDIKFELLRKMIVKQK